MSVLKPCWTMSYHRANCRICDEAWNQRQPHPDSAMLDWLEENTPEIWFNDNGCVLNNLGTGEGILHNSLREAIQQAMEQEK